MCKQTEMFLSLASAVVLGSTLTIILLLTSSCSFHAKITPLKGKASVSEAPEQPAGD